MKKKLMAGFITAAATAIALPVIANYSTSNINFEAEAGSYIYDVEIQFEEVPNSDITGISSEEWEYRNLTTGDLYHKLREDNLGYFYVENILGEKSWVSSDEVAPYISRAEALEFAEYEGAEQVTVSGRFYDVIPHRGYLSNVIAELPAYVQGELIWTDENPRGWAAIKIKSNGKTIIGFTLNRNIVHTGSVDDGKVAVNIPSGWTAVPKEEMKATVDMWLRSFPSGKKCKNLYTISKDETVTVLASDGAQDGWRLVKNSAGTQGYVYAAHLVKSVEQVEPPSVPISPPNDSSSTSTSISSSSVPEYYTEQEPVEMYVGEVPISLFSDNDWNNSYQKELLCPNDKVTVVGTDGFWNGWRYVISESGESGHVCAAHLKDVQVNFISTTTTTPASTTTTTTETTTPCPEKYRVLESPYTMYVGEVPIDLRTEDSWDYSYSPETLYVGEEVTVLKTDDQPNGWRYVRTDEWNEGFVCASHLSSTQNIPDYSVSSNTSTSSATVASGTETFIGCYRYDLSTDADSMSNVQTGINIIMGSCADEYGNTRQRNVIPAYSSWSLHNQMGYGLGSPFIEAGIIGGRGMGGGLCALTTTIATGMVRSGLTVDSSKHNPPITNVENAKARAAADGLPFQEAMVNAYTNDMTIYNNSDKDVVFYLSCGWNYIYVEVYEIQ